MKRVLIKAYAHTNLGDDLFVKILCQRYPKVHFYISCSRFADTAFESIPNLTIMNRSHLKGMFIQNIKRLMNKIHIDICFPFDAEVYIGGSIFIEPKKWNLNHPYEKELRNYKLNKKLPYFIIGANFGPHTQSEFVEIHKDFFRKEVEDICFRDMQSFQLFKELKNVRFAPDVVCTYHLQPTKKKNMVLISCIYNDFREGMSNFNNDLYVTKMVQICEEYLKLGKEVCLLSMCSEQQDDKVCNEIESRVNGDIRIFLYEGNIDETLKLFSEAEYVIASRFHAVILSFLARTPVFPIIYSNKTSQMLEDYSFRGNSVNMKEFQDIDFMKVDENRREHYVFDVDQICEEAQMQFMKLDEFLGEKV